MNILQTNNTPVPQPDELISVYDNGGFTFDRYTISLLIGNDDDAQYFLVATNAVASIWSISEDSVIHSGDDEALHEKHIGQEIHWKQLPVELQKTIVQYFDLNK